MRIVFAGTPEFAATALASMVAAAPGEGWQIALVLTQPDRPSGRGMKLAPSPVKQLALAHGIEVATPPTLSLKKGGDAAAAVHAQLRAASPDVWVVAAYGLILPQAALDIARGLPDAGAGRITALNIHASLLPRWRGAAPIARAIEAGDADTGITFMQMDAGLDTGPMLRDERLVIDADDTTASLTRRVAQLGARLIVPTLRAAIRGELRAQTQPTEGVTYAHKLDKREAWLDWSRPALELARCVRAFDPFPVACGHVRGTTLRLWRAHAENGVVHPRPGMVVSAGARGIAIACGTGTLVVTELQRPGGRRLRAADFLTGMALAPGDVFSATPIEPA
jgi:methionyl-tRNA formyltransferase